MESLPTHDAISMEPSQRRKRIMLQRPSCGLPLGAVASRRCGRRRQSGARDGPDGEDDDGEAEDAVKVWDLETDGLGLAEEVRHVGDLEIGDVLDITLAHFRRGVGPVLVERALHVPPGDLPDDGHDTTGAMLDFLSVSPKTPPEPAHKSEESTTHLAVVAVDQKRVVLAV